MSISFAAQVLFIPEFLSFVSTIWDCYINNEIKRVKFICNHSLISVCFIEKEERSYLVLISNLILLTSGKKVSSL